MDKGQVMQLNAALSEFEEHLDDIKQACVDNIQHIITKDNQLNDEQKKWVSRIAEVLNEPSADIESEVLRLQIKEKIAPIHRVHKRIVGRQQHVLNPKRGAGVTDEMIARAKEHPIEELYDGRLFGKDKRKFGLCPFHQERTPSFYIYPDNHYHCFGCGEHGSSVDFVMKTQSKTFLEAVRVLQ
jgi:hypothetical protein